MSWPWSLRRDVHVRPFFFFFRIRLIKCTNSPVRADSANTMSSALEVLGLSLPYSSSTPATYDGTLQFLDPSVGLTQRIIICSEEKIKECKRAAVYLKKLLERDIKPRYARF